MEVHRRRGLLRAFVSLMLGAVLIGCQGPATPTGADPKALEKEGERLRKEHQKEMYNKN